MGAAGEDERRTCGESIASSEGLRTTESRRGLAFFLFSKAIPTLIGGDETIPRIDISRGDQRDCGGTGQMA